MSRRKHNSTSAACVLLCLALLGVSALGQMNNGVMSPPANTRPPRLENVGIVQHLDAQVPPDLIFHDDTGKTVRLGDYFGHKPLINPTGGSLESLFDSYFNPVPGTLTQPVVTGESAPSKISSPPDPKPKD